MRFFPAILLLLIAALPLAAQTDTGKTSLPDNISVAKTKLTPAQVHSQAIVIDTHADTPQRFVDENYDLASPSTAAR
jgi:membrane dipeptidase